MIPVNKANRTIRRDFGKNHNPLITRHSSAQDNLVSKRQKSKGYESDPDSSMSIHAEEEVSTSKVNVRCME
jgi:hypothetical protein